MTDPCRAPSNASATIGSCRLRTTMISCAEAVKQLWEYLDGIVEETDRALLEEHMSRCRRCCGELEFARELRRVLAKSADMDLPADVLRRLNQTLDELDS
jgi:anti-sigma factor (TIGR02949 family)